jgi:hypothetical protein
MQECYAPASSLLIGVIRQQGYDVFAEPTGCVLSMDTYIFRVASHNTLIQGCEHAISSTKCGAHTQVRRYRNFPRLAGTQNEYKAVEQRYYRDERKVGVLGRASSVPVPTG